MCEVSPVDIYLEAIPLIRPTTKDHSTFSLHLVSLITLIRLHSYLGPWSFRSTSTCCCPHWSRTYFSCLPLRIEDSVGEHISLSLVHTSYLIVLPKGGEKPWLEETGYIRRRKRKIRKDVRRNQSTWKEFLGDFLARYPGSLIFHVSQATGAT